ncbi:hypothetical protein PUW25_26440 (plasmid) [Paenibacillus urinalis]|uniref:Uncharacterized protein n=1 Tax=Paenibacillus urinalis TaxID=521520 RepID=A0ABY7XKN9_9BACL|nr:hypothetical protein [Paenibacillus urinalis]WDI05112.1 hypothetical protein PUW25_26440 [Paenibacillus urinalis]
MATTKILREDLAFEIRQLLVDIENSRFGKETLAAKIEELGLDITVERLDDSYQALIQALVDDKESTGKNVIERIEDLTAGTADVQDLKTKINMLGEYGNFNEVFSYDTSGNVNKHTVTGDVAFTIDYVYTDAANGILNYSEKKYTDPGGKNVTIKKIYNYDSATGNITGISTTTTIV